MNAPTLPGLPGTEERWMFERFTRADIASYPGVPLASDAFRLKPEELTAQRAEHNSRGVCSAPGRSRMLQILSLFEFLQDDLLFATETGTLTAEKTYSLSVKLNAALVKYRTEFGAKSGDRETVLHTASNIVCGDVFLINGQRNELVLEFDQQVLWSDALVSQFRLEGKPEQVASGSADGARVMLQLKDSSTATQLTCLDSASWNPDNLLCGTNAIAALTFCEVPIGESKPGP